MILLDQAAIADMEQRARARFINALPGCKSANLIGSVSAAGISNLSLVSSVVHFGSTPALLGFVNRPNTVPRDTLNNITQTRYFTINHVHSGLLEPAHQCSARYAEDISEFEACGLTELWTELPAPYVAESRLSVGLRLVERIDLALNGTHLLIGEVLEVRLLPETWQDDGNIDIAALDSLAVTALDSYHQLTPLRRMPYAKP